jgi:hypothetical protein
MDQAFAWEAVATKQYVIAYGQHLYEFLWRKAATGAKWSVADLMQVAKAPTQEPHISAGYEWPQGNAKQAMYFPFVSAESEDYEIHELSVVKGGAWKHADLTALTGAVAALIPPAGYGWQPGGTKQIAYLAPGGHVEELWTAQGPWKRADLTALAGAPAVTDKSNFAITGYEWPAVGTKQVSFSKDGHVHELYVAKGKPWRHADLTVVAGAPANVGWGSPLKGFAWKAAGSKQVLYVGADKHIHELWVGVGGAWRHADLTALVGAPVAAATSFPIAAFAWDAAGTKVAAYQGNDGDLHELSVAKGGKWQHQNLTKITGAPRPKAGVEGFALEALAMKSLLYWNDQALHELSLTKGGSWHYTNVSAESGGIGLPQGP